MRSSYLADYYRTIAQGRGTQQALTTTRPQPSLTPEILERYESAMSRGAGTTATAGTPTAGTATTGAASATQPALTTQAAPSALDLSLFQGSDIAGSGEATGYSASENTSGLQGTYGSVLGESIGQGMQSGMISGAARGGAFGAVAGSVAGLPGIVTGGIIGAGTGAFAGATKGIAYGVAQTLLGFLMGDLSLDDVFGYSSQFGLAEGLQSQTSESFNLDASTPEGFVGASNAFGGWGYGDSGSLGGGSVGGFGGFGGGMDGGAGDSMGGSGAGGFA